MRKELQTQFSTRQYMVSRDFEIYYYNDTTLTKVPLHTHNYYEFYFFLEGDISIQIDEDQYPVSCGDVMLIPPRIKHRPIIHSMDTSYRRFVFWISLEYCQHLIEESADYAFLMQYVETTKKHLFHFDPVAFNGIQGRILRLLEEVHSNRFGKNARVNLLVNELVLHLNRVVHEKLYSNKKTEDSLYQNLCLYIEEHLDEDLSLERLSQEFFVSKYHIAHVFKDNLGLSIHRYVTKKRLDGCQEALMGNANITDTYQAFGFGDYSSFYRAFKKEYGVSPKEWQDMHFIGFDSPQ
ncbi:MAG: AraC family transcriptional regulator [Lachnospiraceae bacterium]|nr:AraC family transcriptional regulator [Lachnospiraceae bacterium]